MRARPFRYAAVFLVMAALVVLTDERTQPALTDERAQPANAALRDDVSASAGMRNDETASYRKPGADRSYKADLVQRLPYAPRLVVFGGSRAVRFEPSLFARLTGLPGFNAAFFKARPEDAWAFANFLLKRSPGTRLHCFWALQGTSFSDGTLAPALAVDARLSRYLPDDLVAATRAAWKAAGSPVYNLLSSRLYAHDGTLLWNTYDRSVEQGRTLDQSLDIYLRRMLPIAARTTQPTQTRSKRYFEKTIKLFNGIGVTPVIVIMPYQPRVLAAFRAVGWEAKVDALRAYLRSLKNAGLRLVVLDYLEIASFNGDANGFYDGAHITVANARRIIRQAVRDAPGAFR